MNIKIRVSKATSENAAYARTNERIDELISSMGGGGGQAEVIDIRRGYDETVYGTAGEAVRNQFFDMIDRISELRSGIDNIEIDLNVFGGQLDDFDKDLAELKTEMQKTLKCFVSDDDSENLQFTNE